MDEEDAHDEVVFVAEALAYDEACRLTDEARCPRLDRHVRRRAKEV